MSSMLEELRELSGLMKDDIIAPSEFDDMKRALIARYKGSGNTCPSDKREESNEGQRVLSTNVREYVVCRRLEWEARGKSRIVFVLAKQKWRPFTLCDNLQAHKAPEFVDAMKPLGEIVLFPPNVTDLLQPVDAGAGRMMKYLIASRLDNQMDNDAAFSSKWLAGRFTAPERRILITRWVGEAWEELCQAGYIRKYFEKIAYLGRLVQIPVESRSRVLMITGSSPMSPLSSTSMMSQNPPAATAVTATFLKATTISKTRVRQTRKRPSSRMKPDNPVFVKATMSRFSIPMANRYSPAVLLHRVRPYTGSLCPTATLWSLSNNCTR